MEKEPSMFRRAGAPEPKPKKERKIKFTKMPYPRKLAALHAINEEQATEELLNDIIKDVEEHLQSPAGTLENYTGKYGPQVMRAAQEVYHLFPSDEEIKTQKNHILMDKITRRLLNNEPIKAHPSTIRMIVDYIKNQDTSDASPQYIIVSSPQPNAPLPIQPIKKQP